MDGGYPRQLIRAVEQLIALDARQRTVPTDAPGLARAVEALRAALCGPLDDRTRLALLRTLGSALCTLRRCDEAAAVLVGAVDLAAGGGHTRAEVAARINLGDAHRYGGNLDAAKDCYDAALRQARDAVPDLVDFALQHLGKYFIDAERPADAVACLEEALRLRRAKGDPDLVKSSIDALAVARAAGA
jgi:tetratricopeptide (TPR) repeat protein